MCNTPPCARRRSWPSIGELRRSDAGFCGASSMPEAMARQLAVRGFLAGSAGGFQGGFGAGQRVGRRRARARGQVRVSTGTGVQQFLSAEPHPHRGRPREEGFPALDDGFLPASTGAHGRRFWESKFQSTCKARTARLPEISPAAYCGRHGEHRAGAEKLLVTSLPPAA